MTDQRTRSQPDGAPPVRRTFQVFGLDCVEEVAALQRALGPLVGGEDRLSFDVLNGRMTIAVSTAVASDQRVLEAIGRSGMTAQVWDPSRSGSEPNDDAQRRIRVWWTALSGVSLLTGLALHVALAGGFAAALALFGGHDGDPTPWPEATAYILAIAFGGRFVVVKAWLAARALRPDMNLLMVIAVCGAVAIGEWFEAAAVAFLFALSLTLESWSVARARRAISTLLDLAPATVRVLIATGEEREIPAREVAVGSHFIVKPGERIPLDGRVTVGESAVNQAPITGESLPISKRPGDEVFAGTVNEDGALEVEATKPADDTTLARIIRLVEQAHDRRALAEQWVEKFARVYTPAVIGLALAVAVVPPLFGGAGAEWFYRALVLLVIACPCALVISTPVSIVAALACSARQGVLIKGGAFMELPARLRAIALDKTGTLTRGEPTVVDVIPLNGHSEKELLERAAALEVRSDHPLARAIAKHASRHGIVPRAAEGVRALPGKGVTGHYEGQGFWLGSHRYLLELGQETREISERAESLERKGRTVVLIGNDHHVCGLIAVADTLRPGAERAISALRAAGIRHVVMLTGDNRETAEVIARRVGIDEVRAELLPDDKVAAIERLVSDHGTVAMVGDGINDAPAMARASFGIAMGAIGSDAAIETADVALMTDDLSKLPWLVGHSRRTLRVIHENVAFSLGVKGIFVILTFSGFATLWGAIAADVGTSLLVIFNALRLLHPKDLPQRQGLEAEPPGATLAAAGVTSPCP